MRMQDWRWYGVYGLVVGLTGLGIWRLIEPWLWEREYVVRLLATFGVAVLLGGVLHEGLHLREALRQGTSWDGVKAGWMRFRVEKPMDVRGYRRVMAAPLLLPVVFGGLVAIFDERQGLLTALVWLLGSADDLADWIRLAGMKGQVTRRVGEGLRLHGGEP
ncbi:hypothetical protein [Anaerolinea thermolimosa]|uniref:hypothetical protein n=1 Tax=Anaerolinea thermolimosa TaxID=229919 RepID=UPI0009FC1AB2|nr:hypothetical protein [Anaerolinea thermolimosa]